MITNKKHSIILILLIFSALFFLTGCQVTLEQGEQLEKLNKLPEATQLYWEIVKGSPTNYSIEKKQEAQKRILRLKEQTIVSEFPQEILTNKDNASKLLICDLIIGYNNTPNYNCIILAGLAENNLENKKYFANALADMESEEITTMMINLYPEIVEKYNADIKEKQSKGITVNISSSTLLNYYQLLALYNSPKTLDFLTSLLQSKKAIDVTSLIQAMQLINNDKIVAPLLSVAKDTSSDNKKIITEIFLKFNDPKTYSYLIEQAVINSDNETRIIEHLEKNISTNNIKYFVTTFKEHNYQLDDNVVLLAKSLIKRIPSKEAVSALSPLLHLNDVPKNEATYAEIKDILYFINKNMTKDNLNDLLSAIEKNISTKSTSDYYALDELFQQNLSLINKFYDNNDYLRSFILELKTLAAVYKAKENFAFSIQKARAAEKLETVKLLLEDIVVQTSVINSNQPASKILTNVKFFASKIEDIDLKKLLTSIIKSSQYEKNISSDDNLKNLNMLDISSPISEITTKDEKDSQDE